MIKQLKIADYVTMMNLVSGLASIYFAFNNQLLYAAIAIVAGVVFDKLDGIVARAMKQSSDLGIQLDSFSDLVTFGVAPAALAINTFPNNLWFSIIAMILPICGMLRLARFNITTKTDPKHFIGVPITINGIIFPVLFFLGTNMIITSTAIIVMSYLMVSSIKIKKVF